MNKVENLLNKYGPMLSGDLARKYESAYGVSNEAARKAISRAKTPVKKLYKFKFDKNQLFYYLKSQYMSEKYKSALLSSIKRHSKVIYTYIQAFISQNGYISKTILPAFVGAPVGKIKGHKKHADILQNLIDTEIILEFSEERYSLNPAFYDIGNLNHSIGLEIAKKIIINDFSRWAKEINLVSFEKGKGLFDTPKFAQFQWAYTAPSYIQPLYSYKSEQPGFVIADVFFGKVATVESLGFFIEKLNIIRSFRNIQSFLPILLVDKIDPEALAILKKNKVMIAILNNFFTEKYTDLLNDLVNIFTNATSIINKNPNELYHLFDKIEKSEGRYNDMSGDMFELLVGSHYSFVGCSYLKSKMDIYDGNGKHKELDWLLEKDGTTIVVECKATRSEIDEKFILKWLNENIPFTRRWLIENKQVEKMEFQLWSVGGFTPEALKLLQKAESETQKYSIKHFDKQKMMDMAKDKNDTNFIQIMNHHFFKTIV